MPKPCVGVQGSGKGCGHFCGRVAQLDTRQRLLNLSTPTLLPPHHPPGSLVIVIHSSRVEVSGFRLRKGSGFGGAWVRVEGGRRRVPESGFEFRVWGLQFAVWGSASIFYGNSFGLMVQGFWFWESGVGLRGGGGRRKPGRWLELREGGGVRCRG